MARQRASDVRWRATAVRWLFVPLTLAALAAAVLRLGAQAWPVAGYLAVSLAWQAVRAAATGRHGIGFEAADGRDAALMQAVGAALVVVPLIHAATGWPAVADYPPVPALWLAGLVAGTAGVALLAGAHRALGALFSPTLRLRPGHVLVRTGVYARLRHPIYAAFLLIAAAQALMLPNWLAGPVALPAVWALYRLRVDREERLMQWRFGPAWTAYAARTPRLVPRLGGRVSSR